MNMVATGPATPQVKSTTVSPSSGPRRPWLVSALLPVGSGIVCSPGPGWTVNFRFEAGSQVRPARQPQPAGTFAEYGFHTRPNSNLVRLHLIDRALRMREEIADHPDVRVLLQGDHYHVVGRQFREWRYQRRMRDHVRP